MSQSPIRVVVRSIDHDGKSLLSAVVDEIDEAFVAFGRATQDNQPAAGEEILGYLRKGQELARYIEHQMKMVARGYDIAQAPGNILQLIKAGIIEPSRMLREVCQLLGPGVKALPDVDAAFDEDAIGQTAEAFDAFVNKLVIIGDRILESRTENVKLETEFRRALDDVRKKYLQVDVLRKGRFSLTIRANRGAVYLLFRELISNAFKYRDRTRSLILETADSKQDNNLAIVRVWDNGIGMPQADCGSRIFKAGTRLDAAIALGEKSGGPEGQGLGLSIVKSIVTTMGGRIQALSELGQGTEFQIHLPMAQDAA